MNDNPCDTPIIPAPKKRKERRLQLAAGALLPLLVALAVAGWVLIGGIPDAALPPDLMGRLASLPVLCVQAGCAIVMAIAFIHLSMYEAPMALERAWYEAALGGCKNARWLIAMNSIRWIVVIGGFLAFFWPVR